ncbi:Type I secretion membrane fusion protein, HlyD [Sulfurimonas denitrificans DSM 1251]|uniref:Type I secretion membrane fusion protein, HlyD n=1 Tax=Sulfurimonas denitrificans (strain ATCC 33889 / DSM 1251) TaxID=326298 RepID=Q30PU9_SULDN|nr:HlyD family type I secretion periplasmic adaptor subunit [Sulfurimonas denitrificans]ABB44982.1 Type I secretion membrane fusion protein, HlyD [Sulfurimonas denitrificans DSM 1251]MDD3443572.1 HlyD family type I secretion periplasmic adaptor subunit [Sulfurimonas denitrificans]
MENKKITMPSYDDSGVIRFGLAIIFVMFVLMGGWMAYAPLASSAVAVGKVSADLDKKTIQHLEGGKIEKIYVKDGDRVKKDQILLKLSDVQIKAQLNILNSQYQDALALFARLKAQRDGDKVIEFLPESTDENIIKNQRNIFETTKRKIEDENIITNNRITQLQNQIDGLNSLIKSKENRRASISEEILEWESLYKQRLVDKQRIRDLQRENNMIEGDLASTKSDIAKINEQISELQTQQLLREKEFQKETLERYVEAKSHIADLKSKITATEDTLERTAIVAPIDGIVVGFEIHTEGGVVSPAKPILEIVPQDSKLIVVAQVQITDIDKVQVGLIADIRFSAFDLRQSHVVEGKVVHVSADSFINQDGKTQYYSAKIEVTKEGVKSLQDNHFVLVSGMPAEVMIKTGERTALSYLLKPFMDMFSRSFNEE